MCCKYTSRSVIFNLRVLVGRVHWGGGEVGSVWER